MQSGSTSPSPLPFLHGPLPANAPQPLPPSDCSEKEQELENVPPSGDNSNVENIPRPLSPTKLTPIVHSPLRYQSDADLEALRRKLANAPRPLKKRSSITEPEGPSGPNIQKLLYQRFNTLAGGIEGAPFYQPGNSQDFIGTLADVDNGNANTNGNVEEPVSAPPTAPLPDEPSSDANDNELPCPAMEELISTETTTQAPETTEDDNNNNPAVVPPVERPPSPTPEGNTPVEDEVQLPPALPPPPPLPVVSYCGEQFGLERQLNGFHTLSSVLTKSAVLSGLCALVPLYSSTPKSVLMASQAGCRTGVSLRPSLAARQAWDGRGLVSLPLEGDIPAERPAQLKTAGCGCLPGAWQSAVFWSIPRQADKTGGL